MKGSRKEGDVCSFLFHFLNVNYEAAADFVARIQESPFFRKANLDVCSCSDLACFYIGLRSGLGPSVGNRMFAISDCMSVVLRMYRLVYTFSKGPVRYPNGSCFNLEQSGNPAAVTR